MAFGVPEGMSRRLKFKITVVCIRNRNVAMEMYLHLPASPFIGSCSNLLVNARMDTEDLAVIIANNSYFEADLGVQA